MSKTHLLILFSKITQDWIKYFINMDNEEKKIGDSNTSQTFGNSSSGMFASETEVANLESAPEKISSAVINIIPEEVASKYGMIPFEKNGNLVKIAILDPGDINALNVLRFMAEREKIEFEVYKTSQPVLEVMFKSYGGAAEIVKEAIKSFKEDVDFKEEEDQSKVLQKKNELLREAPVAKLIQVIISHAIEGKASDIHIEPMEENFRVRFRVDGILHVSLVIPKEIGPAIISSLKILANLKIDEKRKPQDGRFRMINEGKEIDFRVSTLPVITGEKIVLRILDKDKGLASIEILGIMGTALVHIQRAIKETYGMILFTGPTGSGKSTSLYALLKILNQEERNIITLEDPIEYNIEGLNQSQVKPEIGYTFANGLRTILRQDPNVIMVGEIRDGETAELAVHAALTGHLMFSTLHTNTAIGSVSRLIDMGIEPFLLSSSMRMAVSQRLVRKICEKCKEEYDLPKTVKDQIEAEIKNVSPKEIEKYELDLSSGLKFYHGKGCDACNGTGTAGRVGIYEVIPINEDMKNIMTDHNGNEEMMNKKRDAMGIVTIRQDGILKILKGLTTIEEVDRVTEGGAKLEEDI
ncbi:MAG: hypothetical protein CO138_01380 [Candidatus Moranbacteria bacterium CG_4_9_14_3_um_filter_33_15]|nr:MAG: hypothetical protein CO138_01380 [Candidatus Moranbacteria bacterium CG_4_9_14_3_um_filter_33_15]